MSGRGWAPKRPGSRERPALAKESTNRARSRAGFAPFACASISKGWNSTTTRGGMASSGKRKTTTSTVNAGFSNVGGEADQEGCEEARSSRWMESAQRSATRNRGLIRSSCPGARGSDRVSGHSETVPRKLLVLTVLARRRASRKAGRRAEREALRAEPPPGRPGAAPRPTRGRSCAGCRSGLVAGEACARPP